MRGLKLLFERARVGNLGNFGGGDYGNGIDGITGHFTHGFSVWRAETKPNHG